MNIFLASGTNRLKGDCSFSTICSGSYCSYLAAHFGTTYQGNKHQPNCLRKVFAKFLLILRCLDCTKTLAFISINLSFKSGNFDGNVLKATGFKMVMVILLIFMLLLRINNVKISFIEFQTRQGSGCHSLIKCSLFFIFFKTQSCSSSPRQADLQNVGIPTLSDRTAQTFFLLQNPKSSLRPNLLGQQRLLGLIV